MAKVHVFNMKTLQEEFVTVNVYRMFKNSLYVAY